jgi:hypothetical protein
VSGSGGADRERPTAGPPPASRDTAPAGQRSLVTGLLRPEQGEEPSPTAGALESRRPARGLGSAELALLACAAALPVSLAAGQTLLALAALLWFYVLLRGEGRVAWPRGLLIGLLLLFAGEWLACFVNRVPGHLVDPLRKHGVLLAMPILAVVARRDPVLYRRSIAVAAVVAAIVAVYAMWQHGSGVDLLRERVLEPRGNGFMATGCFSHHLSYGGSAMLAFLAAAGLAAGGERWRGLPLVLLVPLAGGLLWCYARSAWAGTFVGLLVLVLARRGRRPVALIAIGLLAVLGILVVDSSVRARLGETFAMSEPPPRLLLFKTSLRMLADHPLGIAPGRFSELFPVYRVPGRYLSTVHAHSDPMRALLDGGPLALAGYLVLVGGIFIAAARGLRAARAEGRPAPSGPAPGEPAAVSGVRHALPAAPLAAAARHDLLLIALAAGAAYLVAGLFQTYFWDQEVVMLWVLVAAPAMTLGLRPARS